MRAEDVNSYIQSDFKRPQRMQRRGGFRKCVYQSGCILHLQVCHWNEQTNFLDSSSFTERYNMKEGLSIQVLPPCAFLSIMVSSSVFNQRAPGRQELTQTALKIFPNFSQQVYPKPHILDVSQLFSFFFLKFCKCCERDFKDF